MAVELAVAYVSIVPSAKGIGQKLAAEIGPPIDKAARTAGDRVAAGVATSVRKSATAGADVAAKEIGDKVTRSATEAGRKASAAVGRGVAGVDPTAGMFKASGGAAETAGLNAGAGFSRTFNEKIRSGGDAQAAALVQPITNAAARGGVEAGTRFADGFRSKLASVGSGFARIGTAATVGLTLPIIAAGKQAIDAASSLNESLSKSKVVFGTFTTGIEELAASAATKLGQSRQEVLEAAGTFGNLFVSMKIGQKPAADMSVRLVQLASDLASFNNVRPDEAMDALRSGLVGETEPLRRFGVNLNEAILKAQAFKLGLIDLNVDQTKLMEKTLAVSNAQEAYNKAVAKFGPNSTDAQQAQAKLEIASRKLEAAMEGTGPATLDPAIKAQAAYSLILEQTAVAQGDFARTADGAANKQRILAAQFENAKATLGQALLPMFLQLAEGASKVVQWFTQLSPQTQKIILGIAGVLAVVGPLAVAIGGIVTVVSALFSPIGLVVAAIAALAVGAVYAYKNFEGFRNVVDSVGRTIGKIVVVVGKVIKAFRLLADPSHGPGGFGEVMDNVFGNTGKYIGAFYRLGEVILSVVGFIRDHLNVIIPALGAALLALISPIALVVGAVVFAYAKFEVFRNVVNAVLRFFTEKLIPGIANLVRVFREQGLGGLLGFVAQGILDALPGILAALGRWGLAFLEWIPGATLNLLQGLASLGLKLVQYMYGEVLPALVKQLGEWALAFAAWIPGAAIKMIGELAALAIRVVGWLVFEGLPMLAKALVEWREAFIRWIPGAIAALARELPGIGKAVIDFVLELPAKVVSAAVGVVEAMIPFGRKMIEGIVEGLKSARSDIADAIYDVLPGGKDGPLGKVARLAIPGLATGGRAVAGQPYIVGEKGQELFVPDTDGYVLPNRVLTQMRPSTVVPDIASLSTASPAVGQINVDARGIPQVEQLGDYVGRHVGWRLSSAGRP